MKTIEITCTNGDIREPRPQEAIARDLIGPFIDGDLVSIENPPDFALCRDGEIVGWVEVTTARVGENMALKKVLEKHGKPFASDRLTRSWPITLEPGAPLAKLDRDHLVDLLAQYEDNHPDEERGFFDDHRHDQAVYDFLRESHISYIQFYVSRDTPTVHFFEPGFGSTDTWFAVTSSWVDV